MLLVIDEAQNLTLPALEEIRMLSNLETEKSKLLQIVLIGQPNLRDKLDRAGARAAAAAHHGQLSPRSRSTPTRRRTTSTTASRAPSIGAPLEFPRDVTDRIHARSGGVPRMINVISDATLVFGYGEERSEIDAAARSTK